MKSCLTFLPGILLVISPLSADPLVSYTEFIEAAEGEPITSPTSVSDFISASNISLTDGANLHLGTFNESDWSSPLPYLQGNGGWDSNAPESAKAFAFTMTAESGYAFDLDEFSFEDRATGAGPSAVTVYINNTPVFTKNTADSVTEMNTIDLSEFDFAGLAVAEFILTGWDDGSRETTGGGQWRTAGYDVGGTVSPVPEPSAWALIAGIPALMIALARRRRHAA